MVVAVWVGFDDPPALGDSETGGGNAAPIFHDFLAAALKDSPPVPFRAPPGVALVRTRAGNGDSILEAFRARHREQPPGRDGRADGRAPGRRRHRRSAVDSSLGGLY